jgi:hypothetical protein
MPRATVDTLSRRFYKHLGYWPNLTDPKTYQEKILWRMCFEEMTEAVRLADKVSVRDYVRERAGERYLVEALAVVDSVDDLDLDRLPDAFALKVNHLTGTNILVKDRAALDVASVKRLLRSLLKMRYGGRTGEHWYLSIPPKILVERLLADSRHAVPIEYDLHVFHGRVQFVTAFTRKALSNDGSPEGPGILSPGAAFIDRREAVLSSYDLDWRPMPFRGEKRDPDRPFDDPRPAVLEEMVAIAEKLAGDWGYVRIDLNCIDDKDVYFGEMTFAPAAGLQKFVPDEANEFLGSLWDIHRR